MLGPNARVVEPGRDRVRLAHLAVFVLQQVRVRPVQHARPARGQRRRVAPGRDTLAGRFDADQPHRLIVDEAAEQPHGVAAAADAGNGRVGEPSCCLQDLLAGLASDHRLEIAHERRVRVRPDDASDEVVRCFDVGNPVADRLVDGVLERAAAGGDGLDRCAQQAHAVDVGRLTPDVLLAHVNDALETHLCTDSGRGHPMLACAGLGDDAFFAQPAGEKSLAEGIVDLVRAGVRKVLTLDVDLRPAEFFGKPLGEVQRRGTAHVGFQESVQLVPELFVCPGGFVSSFELFQRGHHGLGDELAAVGPESAAAVRQRGFSFNRRGHDRVPLARARRRPFPGWKSTYGAARFRIAPVSWRNVSPRMLRNCLAQATWMML